VLLRFVTLVCWFAYPSAVSSTLKNRLEAKCFGTD